MEVIKVDMTRPLKPGMLVAVMDALHPERVRRVARVVKDKGEPWLVTVETDAKIEGEAAIEYDFDTPEQETFDVDFDRLRPIIEIDQEISRHAAP